MDEAAGKQIVQKMVNAWSDDFIKQVFFNNQHENVWCYEVEFSVPKDKKPIPEGTVKCFFFVTDNGDGSHDIEFNFENESLRHKLSNTMRSTMYEVSTALNKLVIVSSHIVL